MRLGQGPARKEPPWPMDAGAYNGGMFKNNGDALISSFFFFFDI
jgi:hypothetical protein